MKHLVKLFQVLFNKYHFSLCSDDNLDKLLQPSSPIPTYKHISLTYIHITPTYPLTFIFRLFENQLTGDLQVVAIFTRTEFVSKLEVNDFHFFIRKSLSFKSI